MTEKITFTEEEMKILSRFEDNMERACKSRYCRNMLTRDVITMDDILRSHDVNLNINLNCGNCILELLTFTGRIYFAQKAEEKARKKRASRAKKEER